MHTRFGSLADSPLTTVFSAGNPSRTEERLSSTCAIFAMWVSPFAGTVRAIFDNFAVCDLTARRDGQAMKLSRPLAHAGSPGTIDRAASPSGRGWTRCQTEAWFKAG